jgi:DNA polymerase-3 subunit epsilon
MAKASLFSSIAITDLETTGTDPRLHEIIEIGLILIDQHSLIILDSLDLKVKPEHIETASESALKLNGYNAIDWQDSISLKETMELYSHKTSGALFCSHNVTFDWSFINEAFHITGVENKMDYHRLDLFTMAWVLLRKSNIEKFSLDKISSFLGLEEEQIPHRAINGARKAYEVLKRLVSST